MIYKPALVRGKLLRRYKRFLADVLLDDGTEVIAHCTNSGSMKSCLETGADVYLTPVNDTKRRTRYTWEMIMINGDWVGINTSVPNKLAYEALTAGVIPGFKNITAVAREVSFGNSRFDLFAECREEKCFIEVKNVTLKQGSYALFPDAVTLRGQKHLKTLVEVKKSGMRSVMLYIVQRSDVEVFAPAIEIDPVYAFLLREAVREGVEVIAMQAKVSPIKIEILKQMPVEI